MGVKDAYTRIAEQKIASVYEGERLSRHTTFRIGGPAAALVECDTLSQLTNVIDIANGCDCPWTVIGKGSNILVADSGYDGIVISLGRDFKRFAFVGIDDAVMGEAGVDSDANGDSNDDGAHDKNGQSGVMVCGAGMSLGRLVQETFKRGYTGFEFAVGIPGSFGGAVCMNAGNKLHTAGQVVRSVLVYRPGEGLNRYYSEDLPWIYRYAGIPRGEVVLEAEVRVAKGNKAKVQRDMETELSLRKVRQPKGLNAGSIFRNPVGDSAGRLIDQAGFKGYRIGGAMVSDVHANFIINLDNATARDVLSLITVIRNRVKELYGIELQPEIKFLGFA